MKPDIPIEITERGTIRRRVIAFSAASFVAGFVAASVLPNAIRLKWDLPVAVPALAYKVGDQLCADWNKVKSIVPLGNSLYDYECHNNARYHGIKIHTRDGK